MTNPSGPGCSYALRKHNSHSAMDQVGESILTVFINTNVNDLKLILVKLRIHYLFFNNPLIGIRLGRLKYVQFGNKIP